MTSSVTNVLRFKTSSVMYVLRSVALYFMLYCNIYPAQCLVPDINIVSPAMDELILIIIITKMMTQVRVGKQNVYTITRRNLPSVATQPHKTPQHNYQTQPYKNMNIIDSSSIL